MRALAALVIASAACASQPDQGAQPLSNQGGVASENDLNLMVDSTLLKTLKHVAKYRTHAFDSVVPALAALSCGPQMGDRVLNQPIAELYELDKVERAMSVHCGMVMLYDGTPSITDFWRR